jgi:hypothetical protein
VQVAKAATTYSYVSGTYTQNFNSLGTSATNTVTGGDLSLITSSSLDGWSFLEGASNANTIITAGTGSSNTGDTYNFGAASASDRALGILQLW